MTTLQAALAALGGTLKVKRAVSTSAPVKPLQRQAGPRRVPFGTFGQFFPLAPAIEDQLQPTDSRPPPEHEPNFPERFFA